MPIHIRLAVGLLLLIPIGCSGSHKILTAAPESKEQIPRNLPAEIRELVELTYSSEELERAEAVFDLGEMGGRAAPAMPYLFRLLGDVEDVSWKREELPTSPAREARRALVKIGKPAVEPLLAILQDPESKHRENAVWALEDIGDSRAFEPLIAALVLVQRDVEFRRMAHPKSSATQHRKKMPRMRRGRFAMLWSFLRVSVFSSSFVLA